MSFGQLLISGIKNIATKFGRTIDKFAQGAADLAQRMVKTLSKAFSDGIKTLGNIAKNAVAKAVAAVKKAIKFIIDSVKSLVDFVKGAEDKFVKLIMRALDGSDENGDDSTNSEQMALSTQATDGATVTSIEDEWSAVYGSDTNSKHPLLNPTKFGVNNNVRFLFIALWAVLLGSGIGIIDAKDGIPTNAEGDTQLIKHDGKMIQVDFIGENVYSSCSDNDSSDPLSNGDYLAKRRKSDIMYTVLTHLFPFHQNVSQFKLNNGTPVDATPKSDPYQAEGIGTLATMDSWFHWNLIIDDTSYAQDGDLDFYIPMFNTFLGINSKAMKGWTGEFTFMRLVEILVNYLGGPLRKVKNILINLFLNPDSFIRDLSKIMLKFIFDSFSSGFSYAFINSASLMANAFLFSMGKSLEKIIPDFSVSEKDFVNYVYDGNIFEIGMKTVQNNLFLKMGFLEFHLSGIFSNNPNLGINNDQIQLNDAGVSASEDGKNQFNIVEQFTTIDKSHLLHYVAWKYVALELVKEAILTLGFMAWKSSLVIGKTVEAAIIHLGLLSLSVSGSYAIFKSIKKMIRNYQIKKK